MNPLLLLVVVLCVGAHPFNPTPRIHVTLPPNDVTLIVEPATPRHVTLDDAQPTPNIQNDPPRPPPPFHEEKKSPITSNPKTTKNGETLFQGDIVLNSEQLERLNNPLDTRKAIGDEKYRWTNARVPFVISESSVVDRQAILAGLQHWMDNSCIRFVEVKAGASEPHLIFKKLDGCYSSVGMQYFKNGQEVSIGKNCESMGTVAHEVGHALGFWHEQSRPDRDNFLWIIKENVKEGSLYNFDKYDDAKTYGVPYDFGSIMHYGFYDFSKNEKPTMVPKDVMQTFKIQDDKLSFYDLKLASIMYKCNAKCSSKPACQNQGFVDHNCRCRCPDDYQGSLCERYVAIPGAFGGIFTSARTITSPNYPNKYTKGTRCIWSFVAPAGKRVQAYFTEFDLIYRHEDSNSCQWDYLEVRGGGYEGTRYCAKELVNSVITSSTNKMDLLFKADYDWNKGFKAEITFV